jgi:hypothetical protein
MSFCVYIVVLFFNYAVYIITNYIELRNNFF